MMTKQAPKIRDWQPQLVRWWDNALHWDAFARTLPLDDWTVEWIGGGLTLRLGGYAGATLAQFGDAVQQVSTSLGRPPDEVKPAVSGTSDPLLEAIWRDIAPPHRIRCGADTGLRGAVTITTVAKGCRLIEVQDGEPVLLPAQPERWHRPTKKRLHPECLDVLRSLET